jgi:hypothetical protein
LSYTQRDGTRQRMVIGCDDDDNDDDDDNCQKVFLFLS